MGPLAHLAQAGQLPTAKQMEVKVRYGLASVQSAVHDQSIPLLVNALLPCKLIRYSHHVSHEQRIVLRQFVRGIYMPFGYYE